MAHFLKKITLKRYLKIQALRLVHTDCIKCSRVGQFNAGVKLAQIQNSLSYCILHIELRRSERALIDYIERQASANKIVLYSLKVFYE